MANAQSLQPLMEGKEMNDKQQIERICAERRQDKVVRITCLQRNPLRPPGSGHSHSASPAKRLRFSPCPQRHSTVAIQSEQRLPGDRWSILGPLLGLQAQRGVPSLKEHYGKQNPQFTPAAACQVVWEPGGNTAGLAFFSEVLEPVRLSMPCY